MGNNPILGTIGLAQRAGKLICGVETVGPLCAARKVRCVFLAADAGSYTAKRAAAYTNQTSIPLIVLPYDKTTLGTATGRGSCAICAVSDIGMASAIAGKLAALDSQYVPQAQMLQEKEKRIRFRKGKKKNPQASQGKP